MNNERKNAINIVAQSFYGNRTATEVSKENIDAFILGYMDNNVPSEKPIDRTIVRIPNTDNIVIVYNKYKEFHPLALTCSLLHLMPVNFYYGVNFNVVMFTPTYIP